MNIENQNSKSKKSKDLDEKSFKEISNFKIRPIIQDPSFFLKRVNTICISLCHLN